MFPAEVLLTRFVMNGQTFLQATVRDITERKRADEAIRASEERHRKLFEEATEGIALADAETGILIDCNQGFSCGSAATIATN